MNVTTLTVGGNRKLTVAEAGSGPPLLYLHDFMDVHGESAEWLPFHQALAERFRVIAPAFAGCNGSDEDEEALGFEDPVFDVLDVADALGLSSAAVVGVGLGGWIAAELAIRDRRLVEKLALVGAAGLFVAGAPIADVFYHAQPTDGSNMRSFRNLFFADPDGAVANEWAPDGRMSVERELMRYATFRFASRIGFKPPYLYDRRLRERLHRYGQPALVLWGREDRVVPPSHAQAYAQGFRDATLRIVEGAGHNLHLERPQATAEEITAFLGAASAASAR